MSLVINVWILNVKEEILFLFIYKIMTYRFDSINSSFVHVLANRDKFERKNLSFRVSRAPCHLIREMNSF